VSETDTSMWDEMVENGDLVIAGERSRGEDRSDR
jgi:hypothetical protein